MGDESQELGDRSDDKLTPKKAYQLTEEKDYMGKIVADAYEVTPGYVSQLKGEYEDALETGREKGREEVEPSDFDAERLESALADAETDDYSKCPNCKERIPKPDSPGTHDCPECGVGLEWSESEL